MEIFYALGIVLFGSLAVAYVIYPFINGMMPTIASISYAWETAYWGLLPLIILVLLIPIAISIIVKNRRKS